MNINSVVDEMRSLATRLIDNQEEDLVVLKQREILVDGYEIIVYFNKMRIFDVEIEVLQICGKYFTFLPVYILRKMAFLFFGDGELTYDDYLQCVNGDVSESARKIYVWATKVSSPYTSLVYG